jgi:hypothetical protein
MQLTANLTESRYEYPLTVLEKTDVPSRVLFDVGAGEGPMRAPLEKMGYSWRGFDITAKDDIARWDLSEPCPAKEKAGVILLLDVLEHCISPGLVLQNLSDAIEPGGLLVVTMPNPRWSASRLYVLVRGYSSSFDPAEMEANHHLFPIWPHVCERLAQYAGLKTERYDTLDGPTKLRPTRLHIDITRKLIEAMDKTAQGMSYGLVFRKQDGPVDLAPYEDRIG